jgi:hypothetical protein
MAARVHRLLKVIAFNANDIWRQRYELSKQLQDSHIDVALLSEAHLIPHLYRTDRFPGRKDGTAITVRKGILHNHVDHPPVVSIRTTGVCILIGSSEMLLAAVCKSPGCAWNDADIIEVLSFRRKSLLAGDLNAKHPFWNSIVSNPSGSKLLNLTAYK